MKYYVDVEGDTFEVDLGGDEIRVNGEPVAVSLERSGLPELYSVLVDHRSHEVWVQVRAGRMDASLAGYSFRLSIQDEAERTLQAGRSDGEEAEGEARIDAPIAGLVVSVPVQEGEAVARGQTLVVLEAMKMENEITAPRAGTVRDVAVTAGARVDMDAVMMRLVADPA